jgi:hypothetical protein
MEQAQYIENLLKTCVRFRDNPAQTRCDDRVVQALIHLRESVEDLLNVSTETSNPGQVTKQGVLRTVDMIALNAIPNLTLRAKDHAFKIRILPFEDNRKVPIFTIISVTQGTNGSVYIESDGMVEYKPKSNDAKADTFTVTIKDQEGDTVIKTVVLTASKPSTISGGYEHSDKGRSK